MMGDLIWVEGIIGAGKSTFATEVGERLNLRRLMEPVSDNPYLDLFYKDQKKWATMFQIFMLHKRWAMQLQAAAECIGSSQYNGAILDRSVAGDRVFAKMHMKAGNIERVDWDTYEMAYRNMGVMLFPPTLLIFLDCTPDTALERVKERARGAEVDLDLFYLKQLREGYLELLQEARTAFLPWRHSVEVLHIPWDPATTTKKEWDAVAETVKGACRRR